MTLLENDNKEEKIPDEKNPSKHRFIFTGLYLLAAGAFLIADRLGNEVPQWFFSWEIILIGFGIFVGEKHRFKSWGWLVPIAIGVVFLLDDYYPDVSIGNYAIPVILIIMGFALIVKPRKIRSIQWHERRKSNEHKNISFDDVPAGNIAGEDYLDITTIFGSVTKNILSKNFRGGEATSFFGGTEINLTQADIHGAVILDLTQVFGGTKLIVPPHWDIKSELVNIFGGVEDKRPIQNISVDQSKVIILRGTSIFGGIEIRSY